MNDPLLVSKTLLVYTNKPIIIIVVTYLWDVQKLDCCGQKRYLVNHIDLQITLKSLLSLASCSLTLLWFTLWMLITINVKCLSSPASTAATAKCLENCQDPTALTTKIRSANTESWQTTQEMWHIGFWIGQMNTNQVQDCTIGITFNKDYKDICI